MSRRSWLWVAVVLVHLLPRASRAQATVDVTAPDGAETWTAGTQQAITWSATGGDNVRVELSRDGGLNFDETLFESTPNDGQESWTVSGPATTQARIRVTLLEVEGSATSEADFTIAEPPFHVTSPAAGARWVIDSTHSITWTPGSGFVKVELSREGGPYSTIFPNIPNDGEVQWVVPGPAAGTARIRVTQLSEPGESATGEGTFAIVPPPPDLAVVAPGGGEIWGVGSSQAIKWSGSGDGNVRIELSRGGEEWETVFADTPNDGEQVWPVTGPATTTARVRITRLDDPTSTVESAATFTILGITVTSPNGDEVWVIGSQQLITWANGNSDAVKIELSRDNGITFETLFENTANDGSQGVTVGGAVAAECLLRITQLDGPDASASDTSDKPFVVTNTIGITVTTPNGGELWPIGSRQTITWSGLRGGRVAIELSRDGGDNWELLFASTPNDGQQIWLVSGAASVDALIRVSRLSAPLTADASDAVFGITSDPLAVLQPKPGDDLVIGTEHLIEWAGLREGEVRIELSRDGGTSWELLFDRTENDGGQFWSVTGPPTGNGVIRVTALGENAGFDVTDGPFGISTGTLTLAAPNGGEQWGTRATQSIRWNSTTGGTVRIELSRDGGNTWETLALNTANDGNEPWVVSGPPSNSCRVRISSWLDSSVSDVSDASFSVFCAPATAPILPGQTATGTLGADDCQVAQRPGARSRLHTFFTGQPSLISIDLTSAAFEPYLVLYGPTGTIIAEQAGVSGAARFDSIEIPFGGPFTIVASSVGDAAGAYSLSLASFDVHLLAPVGGETWEFGERRIITWKSGAPKVPATVTLFRNGAGGGAEVLFNGTTNDGVEPWRVTTPAAGLAVLQVCVPYGSRGTTVCDQSRPFTLQACAPTETRACYDGPPETVGVGACHTGTQACGSDGIFDACQGQVLPQAEICGDGVDEDCNGLELTCPPCPNDGLCDDGDPCTVDQCISGQCRTDRPTVQALIDCRTQALDSAVAAIDNLCTSAGKVPKPTLARLGRLVSKLEKLLTRARFVEQDKKCVKLVARARRKANRLSAVVDRVRLCPAAREILARLAGDTGVAIVSASSCVPRP
jgi:hypothetical protein